MLLHREDSQRPECVPLVMPNEGQRDQSVSGGRCEGEEGGVGEGRGEGKRGGGGEREEGRGRGEGREEGRRGAEGDVRGRERCEGEVGGMGEGEEEGVREGEVGAEMNIFLAEDAEQKKFMNE